MNDIQMIKEEINLTFFVDDMILRVENLKELIKKKNLLELISKVVFDIL